MAAKEKQLTLRRLWLQRNNVLRKTGFSHRKMVKGMCREEVDKRRNLANGKISSTGNSKEVSGITDEKEQRKIRPMQKL